MRKSFLLALGLVLVSAVLAAQGHSNSTERRGSGMVMVSSDVMVGTHVLKAGEYLVVCDRTKITFTRVQDNRIALQASCKGRELHSASRTTVMTTIDDEHGDRHVSTLLLRGSNVEHVFK